MDNYDEDLNENPFFLMLHKSEPFQTIFNNAVAKKALICIPKFSLCVQHSITEADVKDHILFPDIEENNEEEEISSLHTLSGKVVLIEHGHLLTRDGFEIQQSVRLLFEETFHSENDNSYRVLCIENFLNRSYASSVGDGKPPQHQKPTTYEHCLDLLWNHAGGQKTRDNLDKMLNAFGDVYNSLGEGENLRSLIDMAGAHFSKAMQLLLKDSIVRQSMKHSSAYMESLKISVETYMMNGVHSRLFRVLTALVASEDAEINKMTRNLAALQLQDLGIRKIFSQNILPAKKELGNLNKYSTPMGRLFCIKRVVTALTRPFKHSEIVTDESTSLMTTDDFLPILIFLIIKSEIPNWTANLVYMRHFHFAKTSDDDEFGFYLASVEAALEHIKSGSVKEDIKGSRPKQDGWVFLDLPLGHSAQGEIRDIQRQDSSAIIDEFFRKVQEGDESSVKAMLQKPQRTTEEVFLKLCHPLCSCDKCEKLVSASRNDFSLVTAYTRDNRGYTALHMAAYYGQARLIDLLVQGGAVVDATDYLGLTPLHLACQRGYQTVILLLMHFGADIMLRDNEGNTALHYCCVNGHEECVKALIFYDGTIRKLQINCVNEFGDTPLHMAAKWGYENIVKVLLESGANATIKNRKKQSSVHVAQNSIVQRLLQSSLEDLDLQPFFTFSSPTNKSNITNGSRSSSVVSSEDLTRQESLSVHSGEADEAGPRRVETASLDEAQDTELRKRKEKLFKAIMAGDIQLVKYYLGIEDQQVDEEGSSTLPSSCSIADMCHPLCQCSKCAAIQKAQVKATQSLSVNVKTASGYSPLHMAVLHGHDDLVRLFLDNGAHTSPQNHKNLTPLHIAACLRKLLTMEMLVDHGAKLNVRDINGDSPLIICSASGFSEGVQLLLQRGAEVNLCNHRGNTALHEASHHSHLGIILSLLQAGADPTIRNRQTMTALNLSNDTETQMQLHLQNAMTAWQLRYQRSTSQETRPRCSSQRVVAQNQVSKQQLFAAFEEEDLKTLRTLTAAIRSFNKEGSLKKAITRDKSKTFLDSLVCQPTSERSDQASRKATVGQNTDQASFHNTEKLPKNTEVSEEERTGGDETSSNGEMQTETAGQQITEAAGLFTNLDTNDKVRDKECDDSEGQSLPDENEASRAAEVDHILQASSFTDNESVVMSCNEQSILHASSFTDNESVVMSCDEQSILHASSFTDDESVVMSCDELSQANPEPQPALQPEDFVSSDTREAALSPQECSSETVVSPNRQPLSVTACCDVENILSKSHTELEKIDVFPHPVNNDGDIDSEDKEINPIAAFDPNFEVMESSSEACTRTECLFIRQDSSSSVVSDIFESDEFRK